MTIRKASILIVLFSALCSCATLRTQGKQEKEDHNHSRAELAYFIESQELPDFTWDREVEGLGATYHNENQGRDVRAAIKLYQEIPGDKYPDLKAQQRQIVRDYVRAYASGVWAAAERGFHGDREDVANTMDLREVIELMLRHGVVPSDVGLTVRQMRDLTVSAVKREFDSETLRKVRQELSEPQPICGRVDESLIQAKQSSPGWTLVGRLEQELLRFNVEPEQVGLTKDEHGDMEGISQRNCVVRISK